MKLLITYTNTGGVQELTLSHKFEGSIPELAREIAKGRPHTTKIIRLEK